jgi:hypothetical protein
MIIALLFYWLNGKNMFFPIDYLPDIKQALFSAMEGSVQPDFSLNSQLNLCVFGVYTSKL